jgi:transcription initiation factor IIE alpha subunit
LGSIFTGEFGEERLEITITCPHCEVRISVDEQMHYKTTVCPKCGKSFQVLTDETLQLGSDFLKELEREKDLLEDEDSAE